MFEQSLKNILREITEDNSLIESIWQEIHSAYSNPLRHYHNISHLDHILSELIPVKDQVHHWQTMIFSIAYHDIIYDIQKTDNEEMSADLAYERLSQLELPETQRQKCRQQILATKDHSSADQDTNLLTDADLCILGSSLEDYLTYARHIRKEYSVYPDEIYSPGRKKILQYFLDREHIYHTSHFREKYELIARKNLAFELEILG